MAGCLRFLVFFFSFRVGPVSWIPDFCVLVDEKKIRRFALFPPGFSKRRSKTIFVLGVKSQRSLCRGPVGTGHLEYIDRYWYMQRSEQTWTKLARWFRPWPFYPQALEVTNSHWKGHVFTHHPKKVTTRRIGRWSFFCKVPSPNTQCMVYLPTNLPSKLAIHVGKIYQTLGVSVILGCLPRPNLRKAGHHGTGFPHEIRGSRRQTVLVRDGWSHFNSL